MGRYRPAAICRRGHVITSNTTRKQLVTPKCGVCGATVISECPACGQMIRGEYEVPGVVGLTDDYVPPEFCADCGAPFPWVSRQGRIYELMNRLDEEALDPATELAVREQLEALSSDLDQEEELRRWEQVRKLAPEFWEKSGAQSILSTVVTAVVKKQLGLE